MTEKSKKMEQRDFGEAVAKAYNESGRKYHEIRKGSGLFFNEFLEVPATLSLLPTNLDGKTVLDAGCGSGLCSIRLAKLGARVVGVDVSQTMVDIAKAETPSELNVCYEVGDICHTGFESAHFDMIVSNYVLENVVDLSLAFSEFSRLLKLNGTLLFSVSHPIRAMANREQKNGLEVWTIDNYFSRGTRISDFGGGLKVTKFRYTFSDYINAVAKSGFFIESICEPIPVPSGKDKDAGLYDLGIRLPQLLIMKLKKR